MRIKHLGPLTLSDSISVMEIQFCFKNEKRGQVYCSLLKAVYAHNFQLPLSRLNSISYGSFVKNSIKEISRSPSRSREMNIVLLSSRSFSGPNPRSKSHVQALVGVR